MSIELLSDFFFWCAVINMGILLWWFAFIVLAHDWVYRVHSRWLRLSIEDFDRIHYAGMAFFKLGIFLLNIVPWLALKILV